MDIVRLIYFVLNIRVKQIKHFKPFTTILYVITSRYSYW